MITLRITKHRNWGTEPLKELFCPKCGSSIIDFDKKSTTCWSCKNDIPRMVKHFFKRKMARWIYYTRLKEKLDNAGV